MFLRNYDVTKIHRISGAQIGYKALNQDSMVTIRNYLGEYSTSYLLYDICWYWDNGYYDGSPVSSQSNNDYVFLWPGGDVDESPSTIITGIDRNNVRYEDYNLFAPFIGGNTPGSGQIYGQSPTVSAPVYNKEADLWERTVTREFKNTSGKTITVRELGVFRGHNANCIIARELLDTPIEVQDDGYFKISFTWKVENPHENRVEIKKAEYSGLHYKPLHNYDVIKELSPLTKEKDILLVRSCDIYSTNLFIDKVEEYYQKLALTLKGWEVKKHLGHFSLYDYKVDNNSENTIIMMDLLSPTLDEENLISWSGYGTPSSNSGYYHVCSLLYLENSIKDLTMENFIRLNCANPVTVNKQADEQVIWVACLSPTVKQESQVKQLDYKDGFCDNLFLYNDYGANFLVDATKAESHDLKLPYNSSYEGGTIVKLVVDMEKDSSGNSIPLYQYIPVQR